MTERRSTFFVLLGQHNGEYGVWARRTDGTQLADGWYVLEPGHDDPRPYLDGPYQSREAATMAATVRDADDEQRAAQ